MKKENNINFIFKLLNKKKVALCLFIEAFLDFIYYIIPYTFALFNITIHGRKGNNSRNYFY